MLKNEKDIVQKLEILESKMTEQSVPEHWKTMVISAMCRNEERIKLMEVWFDEQKNAGYESMDIVKEVLKIKGLVPVEQHLDHDLYDSYCGQKPNLNLNAKNHGNR